MRQTISGLVAAIAVMAASAPAMACGYDVGYVSPCAQSYVATPVYSGCNTGCGGWAYERLPDPVQQYLLRRSGSDLYRSRQLRALSDLSGRHSVRLARLSPPPAITTVITAMRTSITGTRITASTDIASTRCAAITDRHI